MRRSSHRNVSKAESSVRGAVTSDRDAPAGGRSNGVTTAQGTAHATREPLSGVAPSGALVLDGLPLPLVRLDRAACVIEVNEAWRRFVREAAAALGAASSPEDAVGRGYGELVAPLGASAVAAANHLLEHLAPTAGSQSSAVLRCFQDRVLRWYRVDARRVDDAIVVLHTDITAQRN